MSSLAFIRLLAAKSGTNPLNPLIARHLSMRSLVCSQTNAQKVLANNNSINDSIGSKPLVSVSAHTPPKHLTITRFASTAVNHNHSKLWSLERYLSAGLLAIIPAAFVIPWPAMDYLLALSLVAHIHWGVEAIVVDYIRPNMFGKLIPKLALWYLYFLSIVSIGGLFYFNYTDVGLVTALRMIAKM